jgi:hypothetical protein
VAIPPELRADAEIALDAFCAQHSSTPSSDALRFAYEFDANSALLLKQRPGFMNQNEWVSTPVAKFRYSQARNVWSLYWSDANERWHRVSNVKADKDIRTLLQAVVTDPLGVFWS